MKEVIKYTNYTIHEHRCTSKGFYKGKLLPEEFLLNTFTNLDKFKLKRQEICCVAACQEPKFHQ